MKDYLTAENERNHHNHVLYERLLRLAFGPDIQILVAHHLTFEMAGSGDPNEIPSADTLIFDHDLMGRAFGTPGCYEVIAQLALEPAVQRDRRLEDFVTVQERIRAGKQAEEFTAESYAG
jgi:hypothetical protein